MGKGSYSIVYEGKNDLTLETVAIKVIDMKLMQSKSNAEII